MQHKKNGRRKKVTTIIEDLSGENSPVAGAGDDYEETGDLRNFAGYDRGLREYLTAAKADYSFTATLYKFDPINKNKQAVIDVRESEILKVHDVGVAFGSGEYRYMISFPDETGLKDKAFRFNIHKVYDKYLHESGAGVDTRQADRAGAGAVGESIQIIKTLLEAIKPLMPAPSPDPAAAMMQTYGVMRGILKQQLEENITMYSDIAKKSIEMNGENNNAVAVVDDPGRESMLDIILPLVDRYLPIIMGGGAKSQLTVATIKSLPVFKKLLQNRKELKTVIAGIEQKIGSAETEKLLKALKVNKP